MNRTFYYNFKPLNLWLLFNIAITLLVGSCFLCGWRILLYPQMWIIIGSVIFSWGVWYYKYIHPQTMAVITDESIKIDHTNPIKWKDIDHAEENDVYCCLRKHRVLALYHGRMHVQLCTLGGHFGLSGHTRQKRYGRASDFVL